MGKSPLTDGEKVNANIARGVVYVHSAPRALCPHVEWAIARVLGNTIDLRWRNQPVLPEAKRAEYCWEGVPGDGARLASALQGWELKAIRAGRANLGDSYAMIHGGEVFLHGTQITPLISASTHVVTNDRRSRKLLLHRAEIDKLIGRVERDGYTLVLTALYWKGNKVKAEIALAKGKKTHDKREAAKERDWSRDKQRLLRRHNKDA